MKKNGNEDRDLISKLSPDILHYILSHFDIKFIVKTSLLSKKWRFLSTKNILPTYFPNLVFSFDRFPPFAYGQWYWPHKTILELLEQNLCEFDESDPLQSSDFIDFEKRFLFLRNTASPILTFSFSCKTVCCTDRLSHYLFSALEHRVEEIHLSIPNRFLGKKCRSIFSSETIRVLTIRGVQIFLQMFPRGGFEATIHLPNLQYLHLEKVLFRERLDSLSKCRKLKTLVLKSCYMDFIGGFHLSSLSLESLVVEDVIENSPGSCVIEISAPNLKSFRFFDCLFIEYNVQDSFAPVKLEFDTTLPEKFTPGANIPANANVVHARRLIDCLGAFKDAQEVTLGGWFVRFLSGAQGVMEQLPIYLYNLTSLRLKFWLYRSCFPTIVYLLQNAPNVETVVFETVMLHDTSKQIPIFWNESFYSLIQEASWETKSVQFDTLDRLETVEIKGFLGFEDEFRLLKVLLKRASALKRIILDVSKESWRDDEKIQERISEVLLKLPRASSSILISFSTGLSSLESKWGTMDEIQNVYHVPKKLKF